MIRYSPDFLEAGTFSRVGSVAGLAFSPDDEFSVFAPESAEDAAGLAGETELSVVVSVVLPDLAGLLPLPLSVT